MLSQHVGPIAGVAALKAIYIPLHVLVAGQPPHEQCAPCNHCSDDSSVNVRDYQGAPYQAAAALTS